MNDNLLGTKKGKILVFLLSGPKKMTEIKEIISSYDVLRYNILELQQEGYIKKTESRDNKRKYIVTLTEKGRQIADKLKEAENVSQGIRINSDSGEEINIPLSQEEAEKTQNLRFLFHVNVLDDHITVEEVVPGKPSRIFNIYIRQNGGGNFRLWCEYDNSFDCLHVRAAWTYRQVQQMMMAYRGKTKVCPVCGFENPENAKYCMNCGAKLGN